MANQTSNLRKLITDRQILVVPGVYDAFSASSAQKAGFQAVFVSGSAMAKMHLAQPDIGLLTLTETAEIVGRIAEKLEIPLLVDANQGFGNALSVSRAVRLLERAGATAIQIEDQLETKPAPDPMSRSLVDPQVMVGKIRAALDSRHNNDTVISARTDAITTEGFGKALERAHLYADAGADMVFVEAISTLVEMKRLTQEVGPKVPLLHNFIRIEDEVRDASAAEQIGYSVALFPGVAAAAVSASFDRAFTMLRSAPEI